MKRRYRALISLGVAFGVGYALWPSNENLETKIVEEKEAVQKKPKIDFKRINDVLAETNDVKKIKQGLNEEYAWLPSCLRCPDWGQKIKREYYTKDELPRWGKHYEGNLKYEGIFHCKQLHGEEREFWPNGHLKKLQEYSCGVPHGRYELWADFDLLYEEGQYENGMKEGIWTIRQGFTVTETIDYHKGIRHGRYHYVNTRQYDRGTKGIFDPGTIEMGVDYIHGKREGEEIWYLHSPDRHFRSILKRYNWKNDQLHGKLTEWTEEGTKHLEEDHFEGKKHGEQKSWTYSGKLLHREYYEYGELKKRFRYDIYSGKLETEEYFKNNLLKEKIQYDAKGNIIRHIQK